MAASFTVPAIFTAVDKFSSKVNAMGKATRKFATKVEANVARVNRSFRKLIPGLGELQKQFLQLASMATFILLVNSAGAAVLDFESNLVGVGKTTGIEGAKLKDLGFKILEASNKLKTVKSNKLLELAEVAGQLGVKGTSNIVKFSTTLAKLEKASDIQGEEGAKSIARLLTITKEGVGVVDKFASSLVALGNASAASESEILSVASEVARATAAYSLNSAQILGISASLKSLDVAPEAAGSAIGKVFRGIELATISGGKKLQNFAKVMEKTPKQVKELFEKSPQEAFSVFVKGLGKIQEKGGSVAKSLNNVGLSGERVSKGIVPLAMNYQLLDDKMSLATSAYEANIALNKEFEASQKTIKAVINSVVRAWENIFIKQAEAGTGLEKVQSVLGFVADNLETIVPVMASVIGLFAALKVITMATTVVLGTYNVVLGLSTALAGASAMSLRGNAIAMGAYKAIAIITTVVTKAWVAAQWLINAALTANPIGLIIVAIAALIALVVVAVKKYDEWGAALLLFMGPLGWIINLFKAFQRNWEMIKKAFKTDGIIGGLKAIGATILDALLMPLRQVFILLGKIPGLGGFSEWGVENIDKLREKLGVVTESDAEEGSKEKVNIDAANNEVTSRQITEKLERQQLDININDPGKNATVGDSSSFNPVNIGSTFSPSF